MPKPNEICTHPTDGVKVPMTPDEMRELAAALPAIGFMERGEGGGEILRVLDIVLRQLAWLSDRTVKLVSREVVKSA